MMKQLFGVEKPVIGMVHLLPFPGSGSYGGSIDRVIERAVSDAEALAVGGVHGILIENAGNSPFLIEENIDIIDTAMVTRAAVEIGRNVTLPFGINIASNGVKQAIAAAKASGGRFVRATGWVNGYYSSSGFVAPCAAECVRYRKEIDGEEIEVYADIKVKNGSHSFIQDKTVEEMAQDAASARAGGVILTGNTTGVKPDVGEIRRLKSILKIPVIVGSGTTAENLEELLSCADGFIIGTGFKEHRQMMEPVLVDKVREFMELYNRQKEAVG